MKKDYFKNIFVIIFISFFISGCSSNTLNNNRLTINDKTINIEIADSNRERQLGLSSRQSLCEDCGLLFLFDQSDEYSFWMKDMLFPIDIIWIDENKIVYIIKNASIPKDNFIPSYQPDRKADKVLEVNAGFCDKYDINLGDEIKMLTKGEK